MRFLDLSQPVFENSPNCPSDPPPVVRPKNLEGDWQLEELEFTSHTGSHLDAPAHKISTGKTIDMLPLETFSGPARLLDLRPLKPKTPIEVAHLQRLVNKRDVRGCIVLLCCGWGQKRARTDEWLHGAPFLAPAAAQWLVDNGARGVGIDAYSIGGEAEPANAQTHEVLLSNGLWICEELRFPADAFALPQPVEFLALPIHLRGASGAPCRPVLVV
jgi:kynurenine formamidase